MTDEITLNVVRNSLYTAVVCDALDLLGYRRQSPRVAFPIRTSSGLVAGRAKTTLWADMAHEDPRPYELELQAVDSCRPDELIVAAAAGSLRSGIWGELLATAAGNTGCVGALVDGAVRDVEKMRAMRFPVFARGTSPYDSQNRQRVVEFDVPVEIGGVRLSPGDLVLADEDGVVVVPQEAEAEAIKKAVNKVNEENQTRNAITAGMKAVEAYERFGVL